MSVASGAIPPPISWAQRNDLLFVIVEVECKDIEHKVTDKTFSFKGVNVLDPSRKYDVTLNFYKEIDPEKVTSKNIGRCLEFTIYKKEAGPYWPQLTTDKTKLHFLKANFVKWKDESDEEDNDVGGGFGEYNFKDMLEKDSPDGKPEDFMLDDEDDEDSDDNIPSLVTENDATND